ncbi:MAG: aldehyde dehydrogenase [Bacteroidales bacterium]|jgi:aldehyde dehydrogenase (NAD+)|nr:aldehyde dehydrogenase [Bacteroidales bacterium]MDN5330449.1 aldehyde dehydrogenase [Bacteroidales bacterium]NLH53093.1 aldehyde dehydrogenase [Bacteroidales bacterium]NPV36824.1 aldehyde dehydrogenase [Bacteroidales bacterium]
MHTIKELFDKQKKASQQGILLPLKHRKDLLRRLRNVLRNNLSLLEEAILKDFGKSAFETYATELALIFEEIRINLENLEDWAAVRKVPHGLAHFPGRSRIYPEPFGNVLIIGAWNYPYQLSLAPAVPALAAGNCVIVKPSELAPHTSAAMARIINEHFSPEVFHVVEGAIEETQYLLSLPFDKIFFTGSTRVGKIVMKAAAENLIPVTLELGGKSPCIVLPGANLSMAAKRITWGKFLNAGQTCIAPDYLLIHTRIKDEFLQKMVFQIEKLLGPDPVNSESYVKIINERNFNRLLSLIDPSKIYYGGKTNAAERYIEPTLLTDINWDDPIMQDEIFGPLLPVIEFEDIHDVISKLQTLPRPLALYLFTASRKQQKEVINKLKFGGGCINDTIMHIANPYLPFGGIGPSGMGAYHGEEGFRTFTHYKSVMHKGTWFEPPVKYPPYSKLKLRLIKLLMG